MTNITICGRAAILTLRELLTGGSVGARCKFTFSADWNGLTKVAVFSGSGTSADVTLDATGECEIPYEVLASHGGHLWIGVYGTDADTIVKPTVWADAGRIEKGTAPSGLDPEEFSPTLAQQAITAAQSALEKATAVEAAAERGDYDGADGKDAVIWYADADDIEPDSPSGYYIGTNLLDGPAGAVAAAGHAVIGSDGYVYFITEIDRTVAVLSASRVKIKGDKGDAGTNGTNGTNAVIWYTTDAPSSRTALSGGVIAAENLQGPDGAVVAAGQMIVSSNTGKAYWTAGPVEDDVVPLELYEITIAAT